MQIENGHIDKTKLAPVDTPVVEPSEVVRGVFEAGRLRGLQRGPTPGELIAAFKAKGGSFGRSRLPVIGQASDLASARLDAIQNGSARRNGNGTA